MAKFDGRGTGHRLNYLQGRIIDEAIRANASIGDGEGVDRIVTYHAGWSDAKVADLVRPLISPDLTMGAVRRFRAANIGRLLTGVKPGTKLRPRHVSPLLAELARQKTQIALLESRMASLEKYLHEKSGYMLPWSAEHAPNGSPDDTPNWSYPR